MWSCVQNCLQRAQHAIFYNKLFSVMHILHQLHYYKLCKIALVNFVGVLLNILHFWLGRPNVQTMNVTKRQSGYEKYTGRTEVAWKALSLSLSLYFHWGISTIFNGIELAAIYMMQHCKQVGKASIESLSDCRTSLLETSKRVLKVGSSYLFNGTYSVDIHDGSWRYWTPCLTHRCVCIWRYILQNYNYKLHFQNLSIYHIPHVSIGTLAVENLDVCTACDLWDSNIQLTMVKDQTPGPGMPFLDNDTCAEGVLFISARVFFPVWCHPWMDDGTDRWVKKASWPQRPLLYVM